MSQINTALIPLLNQSLEIDLPENLSSEHLLERLSSCVNHLIESDFKKLVAILYRIDVSEARLKQLLKENPGTDAGLIIAHLMIERQEQKLRSRQEYKRDENISDEEKW